MSIFSISASGLNAFQKAIDATSQNIANADTPDYKKVYAVFDSLDFSGINNKPFMPGGVEVNINKASDPILENRYSKALGEAAYTDAYKEGTTLIQDTINTKDVEKSFSDFMSASQDLNINNNDPVLKEAWSDAGKVLQEQLSKMDDSFTSVTNTITHKIDLTQIELTDIQAQMSKLTAGPLTPETIENLNSMANQVLMLSNSIKGYNDILNGVIPPLSAAFTKAKNNAIDGINNNYGQTIIDDTGFNFDTTSMGNVTKLTEFGSQQFNTDMGVLSTMIGSKVNSASMIDNATQSTLHLVQKEFHDQLGVDITKETINAAQYQRYYEANAKMLQVQDNVIGALLNIKT